MYKSLLSFNLNLGSLNKSLRKICLCTIVNLSLILFIIIVSFYLLRRLNSNDIESFITSNRVCPNVFNTKPLVKSLNKLSNNLSSIDSKLDYITGFKNIKTDKGKNRSREVSRKNYPNGKGTPVKEDE
jgi:hypothetical protein